MFTSEQFANLPIQELEYHKFVLTADGKIAVRVLGGSAGDMLKSENLAGLTDYAIARSNLEVYSSDEIDTLLTGYALTGHDHDGVYSLVGHTHAGVYEPVFSKNTGFNKNFGTAAGTVLEGNRDALYEKLANKGQANGYAPLDSGSLIPSMYLPSYVDDVIDVALYASLPVTGEAGKIYNVYGDTIALNGSYRWGGAAYSKISSVSDAVWGHITGTLTDQVDLVSALAGKAALSHTHVLADLPNISQNHFLGRNSSGSGTIEVLSATQTRSALSVYSQSEIDGFTVKLTGDQTIAGVKTFSSAPVVPDSSFAIAKITGLQTALDGKVNLTGGNNIYGDQNLFGFLNIRQENSGDSNFEFQKSHDVWWSKMLLKFIRSRGTIASPTATSSGDVLGSITFDGYDGAAYSIGGGIEFRQRGIEGANMLFSSGVRFGLFGHNNPTTYMSFGPLVDNTKPTLALYETAGGGDYYGIGVSSGRLSFWEGGVERMSIINGGSVGIGRTNPEAKLDVEGNAIFRNFIIGTDSGAGKLKISGTGTADNKIYLQFWNSAEIGSASEVLLTGHYGGNMPALYLKANFIEYAEMRVTGSYGANFKLSNNDSLQAFRFSDANNVTIFEARHSGRVLMPSLPTSSSGLPSGSLWRNGTSVDIVA